LQAAVAAEMQIADKIIFFRHNLKTVIYNITLIGKTTFKANKKARFLRRAFFDSILCGN
jgi:hypothetical protein